MISSIVWLILLQAGIINGEHAPWLIYVPLCLLEILIYIMSLPKICDWLEEKGNE